MAPRCEDSMGRLEAHAGRPQLLSSVVASGPAGCRPRRTRAVRSPSSERDD
jgi:hypothetical protein